MVALGVALYLSVWTWTTGRREWYQEEYTKYQKEWYQMHTQKESLHTLHRRDLHHPNLAMSMTLSFAVQMNYSNCWICQHLPHSTTAPIWMALPLTAKEWRFYDWQGLRENNALWDSECHDPPGKSYKGVEDFTEDLLYKKILDVVEIGVNRLIDVGKNRFNKTGIHRVGMLNQTNKATNEFVFKVETIHIQTNCTFAENTNCMRVKSGVSLNCYSEIFYFSVSSEFKINRMTCNDVSNCQEQAQTKVTFRSSRMSKAMPIVEEENIKYCFTGTLIQGKKYVDIGKSPCDKETIMLTNLTRPSYLPETVYAVCGGQAYTHLPANSHGTCYLAHVIPMIRRVNSSEIQAAYSEHRRKTSRKKRTLTWWQKVLGVIIPNYGVYNTQSELEALSTVLEKHMNVSDAAIEALATEVNEIKAITLQNRMVLDIMLANKGGACSIIKTECCSFVSDPTKAITRLHEDTQEGVKELHKNHGGMFWGLFEDWFGGIGNTLTRTLILIVITVIILLLVFVCLSACIKAVMSRIVGSTSEVIIQPERPQWSPPFNNSDIV